MIEELELRWNYGIICFFFYYNYMVIKEIFIINLFDKIIMGNNLSIV